MTKKEITAMTEFISTNGIEPYNAKTLQVLNIFNSMIVSKNLEEYKLIIENELLYKAFLIQHINNNVEHNMDDYIINYFFIMFKHRWPMLTRMLPLAKDIKGIGKTIEDKRLYIFNGIWYTDIVSDQLLNYIYSKEKIEDLKSNLLKRYVYYEK